MGKVVQELRDKRNQLLGRICEGPGGKLEIRDPRNAILGSFNPKNNETRDKSNRLVGKGNLLATLLKGA